jgi:hypothetical protein
VLAKKRPVALNSGINAENITCGDCEGILLNKRAYQLWTEEYGLILLDMIVCSACKLEAEKLGLNTDEVKTSAADKAASTQQPVSVAGQCYSCANRVTELT